MTYIFYLCHHQKLQFGELLLNSGAPILKVMTDIYLPHQQMSTQISCRKITTEANSIAQY